MFDEEIREAKTEPFEIYWKDLTPECQERLKEFLGGNNGNYDTFPLITIEPVKD